LAGPELDGLDPGLPAASVRLLLPPTGRDTVVVPTWNGNEFLDADGTRPTIRTLTPLRVDPAARELDVDVVLHGAGPLSTWAATAQPGARAAVSGTGRGYDIDPEAPALLLAGDESALPAITMLVAAAAPGTDVQVLVELSDPSAQIELPDHPRLAVEWRVAARDAAPGDELVRAVAASTIDPDARVWVAGEAASVHRIRRHLFDDVGLPRSRAVVRGYWKHGRRADDAE
jgi:NADPH-dependent ferric siderophore reductase